MSFLTICLLGIAVWFTAVLSGGMASLAEIATELKGIRIAMDHQTRMRQDISRSTPNPFLGL